MTKAKEHQSGSALNIETHSSNKSGSQTTRRTQRSEDRTERQQTGITRRAQNSPSSPFSFMRRFGEEMEHLLEDFGMGHGLLAPIFGHGDETGESGAVHWSPQVEVFERDDKLIVRADLPGLKKDDINVDITDDAMIIRGERRQEREEDEEGFYRSERSYGSFYRRIPLPEGVDAENADATFQNGVLEVSMSAPARADQQRRRLEIRDAGEGREQSRGQAKAAG